MALDPSASPDAGVSASTSAHQAVPPPAAAKRRRNPPGMPDPDAEVVALSPEALTATNRFACEICGKGFPRDQNLQLHRREHNLPWSLRGGSPGEKPRKRVYVCPVPTCIYHDPTRALGDLTGIKKHFFRKHGGEKKYGCGGCSKKYAVLSDWQAHVRACGGGACESGSDSGTMISCRRKKSVSGGAMGKSTSSMEGSPTVDVGADSHLGMPEEQTTASSSPSQPVTTHLLQLQQLPVALLQQRQQQQLQHQGQLVFAGYLLFYDCNAQAQGSSTEAGK